MGLIELTEGEMDSEAEKSLVLIKPGNFRYCLEIFECLHDLLENDLPKKNFSRTRPFHLLKVPEAIIRAHYEHMKSMPVYEATIKAFVNSPDGIVLSVYSGEDIIRRIRYAIGDMDPQKARPGAIRAVFSSDSLEVASREIRYLNNVIHASSSRKDSEREIVLWRDYL
jgi:nucleoside diphosphate kinase